MQKIALLSANTFLYRQYDTLFLTIEMLFYIIIGFFFCVRVHYILHYYYSIDPASDIIRTKILYTNL